MAFYTVFRHKPFAETPEVPNEADGSRQESQQDEDDVDMAVLMADCDEDDDEEPKETFGRTLKCCITTHLLIFWCIVLSFTNI